MRKYLYKIDLFCNEYERYDILYENKKYVYIIGEQKIIKVHTFEIFDEEHPRKYYTFNKPENFVDNSRYRKNVEKINKKIYYVHYDKNNFHCEKRVALIYDKKYKIYYLKNKKNELYKLEEYYLKNEIDLEKMTFDSMGRVVNKPMYIDNKKIISEFLKNKYYYKIVMKCIENYLCKRNIVYKIKSLINDIESLQRELEYKIKTFEKMEEEINNPFVKNEDFEYINNNIKNVSKYVVPFVKEDDDN